MGVPPSRPPPKAEGPGDTLPGQPLSAAMEVPQALPPTDPDGPLPPAPVPAPAPIAGSLPRRAPSQLIAGTVVDQKYTIERVLGEGGMGVVYLARDVSTGLHVVLKAVRQELSHRADIRARTLAEGRALAAIDHPNVVHLNAVVDGKEGLWLVMQHIDGESLAETIARYVDAGRQMPLDEALSIFRQIASGIAAAHREGVIHRDLKPANVMIRRKDHVAKVTDFGIAKGEADALAGRGLTKGIIGSLYYMSPEQVSGRRNLDKRVDIYALGVLLYEMLLGSVPFDAVNDYEIMRLHVQAPVPRVGDARPDVPPEVDALIQKACAKDREARFSSCEELIAALDQIDRRRPPGHTSDVHGAGETAAVRHQPVHQAVHQPVHQPVQSTLPSSPRRSWLWLGVVAIALAGGAAALFGLGVVPVPGRTRSRGQEIKGSATPPAASVTASASASASPSAGTAALPLDSLAGPWVGNGRELDAVVTGEALEFRVRHPEQFAPQDYEAGEARFSLRPIPGEGRDPALAGPSGEPRVFAVEDRIRFIAPGSRAFDPARARGTCQDVRTSGGGRPLRASFDGSRLTVEFAKIEPTEDNFVIERGKVVSCVGLGALPAGRVVSTLSRP